MPDSTQPLPSALLRQDRNDASSPRPFVVVIFGASGDLTQRKLVPALHSLVCEGLLPALDAASLASLTPAQVRRLIETHPGKGTSIAVYIPRARIRAQEEDAR